MLQRRHHADALGVLVVLCLQASSLSPEAQETIRMDLLPSVSIADLKAAFEGISVD
jgi:ABC-type phosphate/phosphonate transport system substrate-binding protein